MSASKKISAFIRAHGEAVRYLVFGVLTTLDQQQALDRAGGRLGNKGDEAAAAVVKMVHLQREFELSSAATTVDPMNVN